jgi:hypothetical protein
MNVTQFAKDLIEEINGLNILINGNSLTKKEEDALKNETEEKLKEIVAAMKYHEVAGVIWEQD